MIIEYGDNRQTDVLDVY